MGFLIYMILKMTFKAGWWMVLGMVWLCWAMVALPIALIASATGNERSSRQWMRSMRWHEVFRI